MRIFIILLALSFQTVRAQNYTVIHVIGKIYDNSANAYLKPGYKLAESTKLKFETANARAAVLSSSRGRYVVQQQKTSAASGDLAYTLSSVLSPARGKMSTRAGGINNVMDFQKKFAEGPVAIIKGAYSVDISPASYPTDDVRFFYASYQFNGEAINKKLEVEDGKLIFDVPSFYAIDDIPIDASQTSETQLFYYDSNKQESTAITPLNFVIVDAQDFESIKSGLVDMSDEEQITAIQEIMVSLYGKCDKEQIQAALQSTN